MLLRYTFESESPAEKCLELSLYVINVFNSHPPFSSTQAGGVIDGQTIGRLVQFGLSRKF